MDYMGRATGGRAFSGGKVIAARYYRDPQEVPDGRPFVLGEYRSGSDRGIVSDALHFAADESRYAYEMGFYVLESELDGMIHTLKVTTPGKPKFDLRYRSGYTASAGATAPPSAQEVAGRDSSPKPPSPLNPDEVGIDGTMEIPARAKKELRVCVVKLALAAETVTRTADGAVAIDATFIQTDDSGKQLAKTEETVRLPAPDTKTGMIPYNRALKLANGAVLLHVRIRDAATNRVGSIAIPVGKP
jgi:hypothetical protein